MKFIDYPTAVALAERAVAERGEGFVYRKPDTSMVCMYVHTEGDELTAGCIVGFMLSLGEYVTLEEMRDCTDDIQTYSETLSKRNGVSFSDGAMAFMHELQMQQDHGIPWGAALDNARMVYGRNERDGY